MDVTIRPLGERALLCEVDSLQQVAALHALMEQADLPGVSELVPAARTLMLRVSKPAVLQGLGVHITNLASHLDETAELGQEAGEQVEVKVRYDGEDLDDVAKHTGLSTREVIAAHTETTWTVGFFGFAPGFAYLVGGDSRLVVPRRDEPRTKVPPGAVALAGEFSAVYPRTSPGGWQLIGTTNETMWDTDREAPALLSPGATVRFVKARR
ncbi:allophanate hydrolase subunit 1 [Ornithinimicrobium sp. Arc0846-15]|nr:allophanate hydrolase subunit 1 [Ornithinimicrobium laminariae]